MQFFSDEVVAEAPLTQSLDTPGTLKPGNDQYKHERNLPFRKIPLPLPLRIALNHLPFAENLLLT